MEHPLLLEYGPFSGWLILLIIGGGSIIFFLYQVILATRLVMLGAPDNRFDSWGVRIKELLVGWLGQKKVLRDRVAGVMHVLMFWGFLMLSTDMLDLATANFFSNNILPEILNNPWNGIVELGYTSALIGATAALIRRTIFTPEKLKKESQLEGNFILFLILTITTTSFIVESVESPSATWEPIGNWVAGTSLTNFAIIAYWAHMLAICSFLILIPMSKHMHLVMAVPNVFFHDTEPMAKMRPLAIDDEGKAIPLDELDIDAFGVSTFDQYTWRQIIDGWSCTSCARCQDVCPAYASGKGLNPMQIVKDVRDYANDYAPILLKGDQPEETMLARITEEAVWACTTCHACVDVCPLYIEHVPKLTDLRRNAMMETMEYPEELNVAMGNLEAASNPYGFGEHERGDWAKDLDVKVGEPAEYIYFVGCAASFDERNQKVARATIGLLKEAGLDVGILGMREGCSGDPARRSGNEYLFQMLAETNIATFEELGVKRIITACPHCFHTIGKEYGDYGADDLEIFHHTEIMAKLQSEGKLPELDKNGKSITFHDPCYLGRIGDVVDEPRAVLGGVDVEIERHGKDSFCCGAGGAQMWMEEDADKRVNKIRAEEIAATGCDTVAIGCPFCSIMVKDGLDTVGAEMDVKDIAELLWEQIVERDKEIHTAVESTSIES
ncbi:MAG TPA: (Fe-S)-binding protein [Candidatus Poseidoniales archaeon]|jgi:Fe-S oxidoreductase|nr:(Fe-S)-binding protein [Candidatus Poseidoniales archaeon]HIL00077.1 (Fe-S)-binding protein [Candidatus Poseidoniales archaeon]